MSSWHSPQSIYNLGHKAVRDLFTVPCQVEEKVDGSYFSFGIIDGELKVRSKGAVMIPDAPEKMFNKAVASVKERQHLLTPEWTYRGEYLQKPQHNALAYDRVPTGNIIIFDICDGEESYLPYGTKAREAERIGLECVPLLATVEGNCLEQLRNIIDNTQSVLGGQKIEGVICKQQDVTLFGPDKKALMGKFVSEQFKEVHAKEWKDANPTGKDILAILSDTYGTQTRWHKAVQHLREAGKITDTPQDIGMLIKEIPTDVLKECEDEIKQKLFNWAWPHITRGITRGMPQWYKDELLKTQFESNETS